MPSTILFDQLKVLPTDEWVTLKNKVDAFRSISGTQSRRATEVVKTGSDLLTAMTGELRRRRLIRPNDNPALRLDNKTIDKVDQAWAFVLELLDSPLRPVERAQLARVTARALAKHLEYGGTQELRIKQLYQSSDKVVEALNAAFPGYVVAGLLSMVIKRRRKKHE